MKEENVCNYNICNICNKKLKITNEFKCKCNLFFCRLHRFPEEHQCNIDYKNQGKEVIEKNNPLIKNNKIITF